MAGDIIPVIFAGTSGANATLPIDFGTLGGDVLHIQRILNGGSVAIADASARFANVFSGSSLTAGDNSSGETFLAVIRTPGTRPQSS